MAQSSAGAEFRALAQGICEGVWLKKLLSELRVTILGPIRMMCDNQSAIAKNLIHHDITKHVEIVRHFISEKIEDNIISLNHAPSVSNCRHSHKGIVSAHLHRTKL